MNIIVLGLVIIVNMVLQNAILSYWTMFGYSPNTALVSVVSVALIKGKYYGAFFGLAIGLLQDIVFGTVIGVNGLIYFLIGYVVGKLEKYLNAENKFIQVSITGISTIIYNLFYFFLMFFLSRNIHISIVIKKIISLEILYNSILSIFIYQLFKRVFKAPSLDFRRM